MNPPSQAEFFYTQKWSAYADTILVDCLIHLKNATSWSNTSFPSWFLLTAADQLKKLAGVLFSKEEISDRVELLRMRYKAFTAVITTTGAKWDVHTKYIQASEALWMSLFEVSWFFGAYYHHDEPLYWKLDCLFAMGDGANMDKNEVELMAEPSNIWFHDNATLLNEVLYSSVFCPTPGAIPKQFQGHSNVVDFMSGVVNGNIHHDFATNSQVMNTVATCSTVPTQQAAFTNDEGPSNKSPTGWCPTVGRTMR